MAAVPSIGRASLVERPAAHEAAAAHALYESHSRRIHSYCLHQLGSREDAEDATQIVFMNAFRALRKGVVPQTETAWLFKIAENVCLSRRRSTWRRGKIESPADFELIEEIVPGPSGRRDELIGIEDALAAMPEQQRRAILLREWQGLSYREISEEMELSQAAVETLIFRARRSLAQGLTEPESNGAKKSRLKRALHGFDLSALAGAAKATIFGGTAAVKATAAVVAVTAATGTAVTVTPAVKHAIVKKKAPAIEQTWSQRAATSSATVSAAVVASPVLAVAPSAAGDRSGPAAVLATAAPVLGEAGQPSGNGGVRLAPEGDEPAAPAAGAPFAAPDEPVASGPAVAPSEPAPPPAAPKPEDSLPAAAPPAAAPPVAASPPKEKETTSAAPVPAAPSKDSGEDSGKGKAETPAAAAPAPSLPVAAAPKGKDERKGRDDGKGKAKTPAAAAPVLPVAAGPAPKAGEDGKGKRGEEPRSSRAPQASVSKGRDEPKATDAKPALVAATQPGKEQPRFKEEARKEEPAKAEARGAEKSEAKVKEELPAKSDGPLYSPSSTPPPVTAGQVSAPVVPPPSASDPPSSPVPAPAPALAPPVSLPPVEAERKDERRDAAEQRREERRDERKEERRDDRGKGKRK